MTWTETDLAIVATSAFMLEEMANERKPGPVADSARRFAARLRDIAERMKDEGQGDVADVPCPHYCGICDSPKLTFSGMQDGYPTWTCPECDWWHIAKDCCAEEVTEGAWT